MHAHYADPCWRGGQPPTPRTGLWVGEVFLSVLTSAVVGASNWSIDRVWLHSMSDEATSKRQQLQGSAFEMMAKCS